jgi:NADH-quinone oxidoreductase subunit L
MNIELVLACIVLAPLVGSCLTGFFAKRLTLYQVSWITIPLMLVSFGLTLWVAADVLYYGKIYNFHAFTWAVVGDLHFNIGFLIDQIAVYMMVVVTFVSTLVHIYSISYMYDDPGYARFFSYISGFTFMMLCLVTGNNFLMLFFGWEGVGLFSYLLIGFWFHRDVANIASFRAFIANRVGDLGFLIGIAVVLFYFNSLDYRYVFENIDGLTNVSTNFLGFDVNAISLMCILLFIGGIGKSAQVPLHIWLEGSMEGPTPISALIHAATMVTAGVFMVARLSPMFVLSEAALSTVLIIGSTTCLFMGILAIVQYDIKRVIAFCTLSQLGYMMTAQGASAFSIGMFHLMTHAAFKALLFLAAGSVILGLHHEQDMRKMGGLKKYMPVTYVTTLIGGLALAAIPPFSGFYSKDAIIEVTGLSTLPGSGYAYFMVVACAFVTAFYTFRMIFYTFHGQERFSQEQKSHIRESSWPVMVALIALSIPAAIAGIVFFNPMQHGFFGNSVAYVAQYDVIKEFAHEAATETPWQFMVHGFETLPFWLAISAIVLSYILYGLYPSIPAKIAQIFKPLHWFLVKKYLIDDIFDNVIGRGGYLIGFLLWKVADELVIDKGVVHGSANMIYYTGSKLTKLQTGYIYHYAIVMASGLLALLIWMLMV